MYLPFEQLSPSSRVWIYSSSRPFTEPEQALIRTALQTFCESWGTHGKGMYTSFEILHEQLLVLAVDESQLGASGCSIDASVRTLRQLEESLGLDLVDQGKITLKTSEGALRVMSGLGLKSKVEAGEISPALEVLQPNLQTKSDLQALWQPVLKSWLSRYFPN
jgi:hypothetical protein